MRLIVIGIPALLLIAGLAYYLPCRVNVCDGDSLSTGGGTLGSTARPGQEFVLVLGHVHNVSDAPLTLERIELVPKVPDWVTIKRIEVSDRLFGGGTFDTYPPVDTFSGKCEQMELVAPGGFVVEPDGEHHVAVWLVVKDRSLSDRARARAVFKGHRYVYEQGGRTYEQVDDVGLELTIRNDARAERLGSLAKSCPDAELLPG